MKTKAKLMVLLAASVCAASSQAKADVKAETKAATKAFAVVPDAELPAQAAIFAKHGDVNNRKEAAVGSIKAAMAMNPAATPLVLASIVSAVPEAAADVTMAAVAAFPRELLTLVKIAVKNAPDQSVEIFSLLAAKYPQFATAIASVVSKTSPDSQAKILLSLNKLASTDARIQSQSVDGHFNLPDVQDGGAFSAGANPFNSNVKITGNAANNGDTAPETGSRTTF